MAYPATTTPPRNYNEIEHAIESFDTTNEWLSFYLAEARRLKKGETPTSSDSLHETQQRQRAEYFSRFVDSAIRAQQYHLDNSGLRDGANSAIGGAHDFSVYAIKLFGMADSRDVRRLFQESLSKRANVSGFGWHRARDSSAKECRRELIKEAWKDGDLADVLVQQIKADFGNQTSGVKMDNLSAYLGAAALEFHKKVFIPVVITRVFPPPSATRV